jgi:hypothetical protein
MIDWQNEWRALYHKNMAKCGNLKALKNTTDDYLRWYIRTHSDSPTLSDSCHHAMLELECRAREANEKIRSRES